MQGTKLYAEYISDVGYGAAQNMWMKGVSQSMFQARA